MVILIDAENPNIQHPFIIKGPEETQTRSTIFQHNKSYIWQSHSSPHQTWQSLDLGLSAFESCENYLFS